MDNFESWSNNIYKALKKDKHKKIVLVAGASSSGKTFNAARLAKQLGCHGMKAVTISCDAYYKGLTDIIVEKAFAKNTFAEQTVILIPQICDIVKKHTKDLDRPVKFSPDNFKKMRDSFASIMPQAEAQKLIKALHKEYWTINFDSASTIDYLRLATDIKTFINEPEKDVYFPDYSFKKCESTFNPENRIKGADYDCIIIEGLFVLRKELLSQLNSKNILKTGVTCDLTTLFTRRINRDLMNANSRTITTPEQEIMGFITYIMPSYFYEIYPTLQEASFILNTEIKEPVDDREVAFWQRKYRTTDAVFNTIKDLKMKEISSVYQEDFFLENITKPTTNNINVCLRKQNNELVKLSIKAENDVPYSIIQNIEEFDLATMLQGKARNINLLMKMFGNRGFETTVILHKVRKVFEYQNCRFKVDIIENFGIFIEFYPMPMKILKQLKKLLNLQEGQNYSYFLLFKDKLKELAHELKAVTYNIENLDVEQINKEFRVKKVEQYILDFNSKQLQEDIINTFGKEDIDLSIIGSALIENIDGINKLILLDATESRIFFKQKLDNETTALWKEKYLLKSKTIKRYTVIKSLFYGVKLDCDEDNKFTLRIRFDRTLYTIEQASKMAKHFFKPDVKFIIPKPKAEVKTEDTKENNVVATKEKKTTKKETKKTTKKTSTTQKSTASKKKKAE